MTYTGRRERSLPDEGKIYKKERRRKMRVDLKDKVVIVTGGGGAIGGAMAEAFAENGAKVVVAISETQRRNAETVMSQVRYC